MLLACLARPNTGFGDHAVFPDVVAKSAALCHSFSEYQPFVDGNKRTGLTAMGVTLRRNGFFLLMTQDQIYEAVLRMADKEADFDEFHAIIRSAVVSRIG